MAYLFDTDNVIEHLADEPSAVRLLKDLSPSGVAISMVSFRETVQGLLRSSDRATVEAKFQSFLTDVPIAPFSQEVARRCAALREELRVQGKRVRPRALDLITAATALEHNLTLVTRNTADYADIPGLTLY
jgi:predicted nucleic acid-binding protein